MEQDETVILKMDIHKGPRGTEFVIMQTPAPLWNALPIKAELIQSNNPNHADYFKRFYVSIIGILYGVTFYHTEK